MLGGRPAGRPAETAETAAPEKEDRPSDRQTDRPSLEEQRVDLDRRLRAELERQGLVVTGKDVARVVGQSVGKGIEWTG